MAPLRCGKASGIGVATKRILEVENVSKRFCQKPELALRYAVSDVLREMRGKDPHKGLRRGEFWALKDVSFTLDQGEVVGVIGHNGAGKSTLINLVSGLMRPTCGLIKRYTPRVVLMDNNGGLNMLETGRENIAAQLALHGCLEGEIAAQSEAAIRFAELGTFIDAPAGTYSMGMKLRLAFSIYTCLKPDMFIVDEAISGGDIRFRRKFQNYLKGYLDDGGSILFCSHELFFVQSLCKNTLLLDAGHLLAFGPTLGVLKQYQDLMKDIPDPDLLPTPALQGMKDDDEANTGLEDEIDTEVNQETASATLEAENTTASPVEQNSTAAGEHTHQQAHKASDNAAHLSAASFVESLRMFAPDGGSLIPGKPAVIEIICESSEDCASMLVSVEISNGSEFPVATIIDGFGDHRYFLKSGRNVFTGNIASLPLMPGKYEVRACICDEETAAVIMWSGYEDVPYSVEVERPMDKEFNLLSYRNNSVYVRTDWI